MNLYEEVITKKETYLYNSEEELEEHLREMVGKGAKPQGIGHNDKILRLTEDDERDIRNKHPEITIRERVSTAGNFSHVWKQTYVTAVSKPTENDGASLVSWE